MSVLGIYTDYSILYVSYSQTVELNKQLQVQLSGVRGEHQTVLDQLKEAHSLLDKHIETCNRAQENEVNHFNWRENTDLISWLCVKGGYHSLFTYDE